MNLNRVLIFLIVLLIDGVFSRYIPVEEKILTDPETTSMTPGEDALGDEDHLMRLIYKRRKFVVVVPDFKTRGHFTVP